MSGFRTATAIALAMGVAGAMVLAEPASAAQQQSGQQAQQGHQQGQSAQTQDQKGQRQASAQLPSECTLEGIDSEDAFFNAFDDNNDNIVTRDEYLNCLQSAGANAPQNARQTLEQQFAQIDPDGDQQVDRGEMKSDALKSAQRELQQASRQQSGQGDGGQGTQVRVQQQPAQVTVQEKQPKIMVEEQPAQVTVEQRQPKVTVDQPDAQVKVMQPEPDVTIKQAKPDVKVTEAQPKVQVKDAKPQVNVEQAEREQTRQLNQQGQQSEQQRQQMQQAQQDEDRMRGEEMQGERSQQQASQSSSSNVEQLRAQADQIIGRDVVNRNGDEVGELKDLVVNPQDGQVYAVLSVGGFLGIGDKDVALPFDRLQTGGDNITLMSQKDEEQLENLPAYNEGDWRSLSEQNQ